MQSLLFLSRVALLCNICFLVVQVLRYVSFAPANGPLLSTLVIAGYLLSFLLNAILLIAFIVLKLSKKKLLVGLPRWIIAANLTIFLLQIILLIYNDSKYYS